jgi:hypothetical protein
LKNAFFLPLSFYFIFQDFFTTLFGPDAAILVNLVLRDFKQATFSPFVIHTG